MRMTASSPLELNINEDGTLTTSLVLLSCAQLTRACHDCKLPDVLLDTGFSGQLLLPYSLAWPYVRSGPIGARKSRLATGDVVFLRQYKMLIQFGVYDEPIEVMTCIPETDEAPQLVGLGLLGKNYSIVRKGMQAYLSIPLL